MSIPPCTLYVGNLPFGITEAELREAFAPHGEIAAVRLALDHRTGRFRGFGFVSFASSESAARAAGACNGMEIDGRALRVSIAQPLRDDPAARRAAEAEAAAAPAASFDKSDLKRPLGPREDMEAATRARRRAYFAQRLQQALLRPRRSARGEAG